MTAVTFLSLEGEERAGEVWSPGPFPRSVWVLCEDGAQVVHMDKRRALEPPLDPRTDPLVLGCDDDGCLCMDVARVRYHREFRYAAPPLLVREWARTVALFEWRDDCDADLPRAGESA